MLESVKILENRTGVLGSALRRQRSRSEHRHDRGIVLHRAYQGVIMVWEAERPQALDRSRSSIRVLVFEAPFQLEEERNGQLSDTISLSSAQPARVPE